MKFLIVGATGLLGQAMCKTVEERGHEYVSASRAGSAVSVDISDLVALRKMMADVDPDAIINCAAVVDVSLCETRPDLAWTVNARPASVFAEWSQKTGRPFVYISTDHYFPEGGNRPHDEGEPVSFLNEYARTKFSGECFALQSPHALVLRTAIVGKRGWGKPTFAEWALQTVLNREPATLFADSYTSLIHVDEFCMAALDLLDKNATGLYNVAAAEVFSKADFVSEIARQLKIENQNFQIGTVSALPVNRASSLGLDVSKAEQVLGYQLPSMQQVVQAVIQSSERDVS